MKKTLEVIGWVFLFGFTACFIVISVSNKFTPDQYIAAICAAVLMGLAGMTCLVIVVKKNVVQKECL